MRDVEKRRVVLEEFHQFHEYEFVPGLRRGGMYLNTDAMADEIVLLRERLALREDQIYRLRDDLRAQVDLADLAADWADWAKGVMERLRNELKTETETVQYLISERTADRKHWGAIEDSLDRAERILAALRKPSESIMYTAYLASFQHTLFDRAWAATLCAAVAAAEQEVDHA